MITRMILEGRERAQERGCSSVVSFSVCFRTLQRSILYASGPVSISLVTRMLHAEDCDFVNAQGPPAAGAVLADKEAQETRRNCQELSAVGVCPSASSVFHSTLCSNVSESSLTKGNGTK